MFAFIVRRVGQAVFVMLVISLVGFSIKNKIGDPVRDLVGERVTPAERAALRDKLGLNDPFLTQYVRFVGNAAKGDLGLSFFYKKPALHVIISKAPATLELVFVTTLILIFVSLPVGLFAAIRPQNRFSRFTMAFSTLARVEPGAEINVTADRFQRQLPQLDTRLLLQPQHQAANLPIRHRPADFVGEPRHGRTRAAIGRRHVARHEADLEQGLRL